MNTKHLRISQRRFAESIGMGYSVLNEILNGRRPVIHFRAPLSFFDNHLMIIGEKVVTLQL